MHNIGKHQMEVSMLFQSLKYGLAAMIVSLLLLFVMLNLMIGCESWEDVNCVSPKQFISIITRGLI